MHRSKSWGFTTTEVLVSFLLLASLMATVWGTLSIGNMSSFTSEKLMVADQSARQALRSMEEELSSAQIYSYANTSNYGGTGYGKFYVKFRRPNTTLDTYPAGGDGIPDIISASDRDGNGFYDDPLWQPMNQMRMYVWCPPGSLAASPCVKVRDKNNNALSIPAGTPPGVGPLLLVRAKASNTYGEISGMWDVERVIAPNVSQFAITLLTQSLTTVNQADFNCGAFSPAGNVEACVNRRAHDPPLTYGVAFNSDTLANIFPAIVDVTMQITTRTPIAMSGAPYGRLFHANARARVKLRNPQW